MQIRNFRDEKGYFFKTKNITLAKYKSLYYIQLLLPVLILNVTLYKQKKPPFFRDIILMQYLFYIVSPIWYLLYTLLLIGYYTLIIFGTGFYVFGRLVKALGYMLLLMPKSSKLEVNNLFEIWGVPGD